MKATVAYEAARRQKPAVKSLKWKVQPLRSGDRSYVAKGEKGVYIIKRQKPNRRLGIFRWGLFMYKYSPRDDITPRLRHDGTFGPGGRLPDEPVMVDGRPMSLDDLSDLKAFASSFDAIPSGTVIAVSEEAPAAKEACASCGHAKESPTREEWEVVVSHPPAAHRGAIMSRVGPGEARDLGDKIILGGFHDDDEASRVAGSIAKQYRVAVTFGPRLSILNHAAEAPRGQRELDEHAVEELDLFIENDAGLYKQKVAVIDNLKKRLAKGTYDPTLAAKLWAYWVDAGAKAYDKEFGSNSGAWHALFPADVRREVAKRVEQRERTEMELQMKSAEARPLA